MKKIILIGFLAIGVILSSLMGCSTEFVPYNPPEPVVNYQNPMKEIGEIHNMGLDFVIDEIKSMKGTRSSSEIDIFPAIEKFVIGAFPDLSEEQMAFVHENLPLAVDVGRTMTRTYSETDATENQKLFLGQLDAIMSDGDMSILSLRERIVSLEEEATNMLTEEELYPILAGTAIAYYTLDYWHNNVEKWSSDERTTRTEPGFSWKELGKSDVEGGVAAAAGGGTAWLLGCGPVGWKAWAAVVAGGAVAGSAQNAINQLW